VAVPLYQTLDTDTTLIGDAFQVAVAEHHRRLSGLAYVLTGDRRAAEEMVAEAYARVWGRFRRNQIDDLGPYLRRTVVNLAHSRRRRWKLERDHAETHGREPRGRGGGWGDERGGGWGGEWGGGPGGPGVVASFEDRVDARRSLHGALLTLPVEQRAVIVLRHLEDLSEDETARVLRIRPGTVKSRLARGLEALRVQLAETEETP
jgi:RNA polymerase sigma factor (sigma-70 family)